MEKIKDKKIILVVDDEVITRKILCDILSTEYSIVEAQNGKEALSVLLENPSRFSAVMLDVIMPEMDGYTFLEVVNASNLFASLPIIVITGNSDITNEIKALEYGAWDFVPKPYNPAIIQFRLKNAIERSQLSALQQLKYIAEFDTLTGIYNKNKFFSATKEMLEANPEREYAFIRFDMDRFQLINSFFGVEVADKLLKYIASKLEQMILKSEEIATFGRVESDIFCVCYPNEDKKSEELMLEIHKIIANYPLDFHMTPCFGIYVIKDIQLPISIMYDKATLAAKTCKGSVVNFSAFYTDELSECMIREQEIINEMVTALQEQQFYIQLQPKYSLKNNLPSGAEVLVRWNHPVKGELLPGEFIPIFERNGFIAKLDYYVWEKACQLLRKWIDEGRRPYPISVNVSPVNLYNPQLADLLINLVKKYELEARLLNLELTESAYIDNPKMLDDTMARLQAYGFIVMLDDFGSGYSSLNLLKDIAVDVLKIDMRFLSKAKLPGRGENIIASVIRMAKWINLPVIMEGVETREQVDFLRSVGCDFVQGFYFARPMAIAVYEELMETKCCYYEPTNLIEEKDIEIDKLWVSDPWQSMHFSNFIQPVVVFEFSEDKSIEILRVNDAYYELFNHENSLVGSINLLNFIDTQYHSIVIEAFKTAATSQKTVECQYIRYLKDGGSVWLSNRLKLMHKINDKYILFGVLTDITAQKKIDEELKSYKALIKNEKLVKHTMLIIDDVKMNRVLLKDIFKEEYFILEAKDGKEGLEVLESNPGIDIILLDMVMPIMNGTEFLHHKKGNPEISNIPVVIITANDNPEHQINTLTLGVSDYITKPFLLEVARKRVHNVVELNQRLKTVLKEYGAVVQIAQTDQLTGIYNRITAESFIEDSLGKHKNKQSAMFMLDIDNFKNINDTYGHIAGDKVLIELAHTLQGCFRNSDIVARMGGDEFLAFIEDIPSMGFIDKKCQELVKHIHTIVLEKTMISCSIGVAISGIGRDTFTILYQEADKALYNAKEAGKNTYHINF